MKIGEMAVTATAIILGLALLLGAGMKCSMESRKALSQCIEATGKPLECKAAIGESL